MVKRITSTNVSESNNVGYSSLARSSRKTRRRNSRLSSASGRSCDTLHPCALSKTADIERLMRIILDQGETIHSQLKKLQEREGQIETFEAEVHQSRTKTAGKDYLLNAYLENLSDSEKGGDKKHVPECLQEMVDALAKVHQINEKLTTTEETLSDLHSQVSSRSQSAQGEGAKESNKLESEVSKLRSLNDRIGKEIDYNRDLIHSMKAAFIERKALVSKLEEDVGHIEIEGQKLEVELKRVMSDSDLWLSTQFDQELTLPPPHFDIDDDEDLIKDILASDNPCDRYQLSSSQLYEENNPKVNPTKHNTDDDLYKLHILPDRINATGSPGSSSGNSTSGCGTGSEKSVRFCDRDTIMATPDLPPLPQGDFPGQKSSNVSSYTKSILKSVDPSGDLDSNSDTGLSSLHSSSDEGTYVLDTLV